MNIWPFIYLFHEINVDMIDIDHLNDSYWSFLRIDIDHETLWFTLIICMIQNNHLWFTLIMCMIHIDHLYYSHRSFEWLILIIYMNWFTPNICIVHTDNVYDCDSNWSIVWFTFIICMIDLNHLYDSHC